MEELENAKTDRVAKKGRTGETTPGSAGGVLSGSNENQECVARFSLVLPDPADPELLSLLSSNDKVRVLQDTPQVIADARVVDVRSGQFQFPAALAERTTPAFLLVIDQHTSSDFIDSLNLSAQSAVEMITLAEISSPVFELRLSMLCKRAAAQTTGDVVRDNAYSILRTVMQLSNDWMVLKGLDHKFLLASKTFCSQFGLTEDEILGKDDLEIGTPRDLVLGKPDTNWIGYWEQDDRVTDSGEPVLLEGIVVYDEDDAEVTESTKKVPLKDASGRVYGMLVVVFEITSPQMRSDDEKRIAERRKLQKRDWEKRRNLSRSPALLEMHMEKRLIEVQKQASEKAFVAKNQFVAAASHDLRQPLHAIGLFLHALENIVSDSDAHRVIRKIKRCHQSLNDLLNSLLDISCLDANVVSVKKTHFSVNTVLDKLTDELREKAENQHVEWRVNSDNSIVYTDEILLARILRNLLTNAINHSAGRTVTVRAAQLDNTVEVVVSDTGDGIPVKLQESIFDEFFRIESAEKDIPGLGLGLAIVRRLCLLLDIKLEMQSIETMGTEFTLTVQPGNHDQLTSAGATITSSLNTSPSILVVDDEAAVREAVEAVLLQQGCRVATADSAEAMINRIHREKLSPDLILVDYRLKNGVTGDKALSQIEQATGIDCEVIIITGETSEDDLREINSCGYKVLQKPVSAKKLLGAVKEALSPESA